MTLLAFRWYDGLEYNFYVSSNTSDVQVGEREGPYHQYSTSPYSLQIHNTTIK